MLILKDFGYPKLPIDSPLLLWVTILSMNPFVLVPYQADLIEQPVEHKIFLEGPAGSGKTTVGVERMLALLDMGIPASQILVLVPQRTLASPYYSALRSAKVYPGGQVNIQTVGGLARRSVELFWPLIAAEAGFSRPELPPSFLTLETALYYMAYLVRPLFDEGLFDSVTIDRNRVYSQILDNLNKAAIIRFPYTEISQRLRASWIEDTAQVNVFEDAQRCANLFREYCLQNNLLDFSLQIEIFTQFLWPLDACRDYLQDTYQHLIYDNIEEDNPVAHDLLIDWLPNFTSALLIYDQDAGYRRFLGADPESGYRLLNRADAHHIFVDSLVAEPRLNAFCDQLGQALERTAAMPKSAAPRRSDELAEVLEFPDRPLRFYPQMLDWTVEKVESLLQAGTPPGEIVLLAPLLPDSLRFALSNRLAARGIPFRSHRPSRSLREEPAAQALLTLAALAHPDWGIRPSTFEIAYALVQSIDGIDLIRAQMLVDSGYRASAGRPGLGAFEKFNPDAQERITFTAGNRYEILRQWIEAYAADPVQEPDFFFTRLFGEVLSQEGFAFHSNYDTGIISANLIESAQKFRWAVQDRQPASTEPELPENPLGKEYLKMIQDGILAAQYVQSWNPPAADTVLLAPAYTFLLANLPVDHQFWLDVGSSAWAERLYQPLTHPYILSRGWPSDRVWTDVDEYEQNRDVLYRMVVGLSRRCRKRIHLGICDLGEGGYEARGMLLRAIQVVLAQSRGYAR
jgi:hypothetical protein